MLIERYKLANFALTNPVLMTSFMNGPKNIYIPYLQVTQSGHEAILSAPWYLNYIKYGSDWIKYYDIDPLQFGGNSTQQDLLLGGEVVYCRATPYKFMINDQIGVIVANSQCWSPAYYKIDRKRFGEL